MRRRKKFARTLRSADEAPAPKASRLPGLGALSRRREEKLWRQETSRSSLDEMVIPLKGEEEPGVPHEGSPKRLSSLHPASSLPSLPRTSGSVRASGPKFGRSLRRMAGALAVRVRHPSRGGRLYPKPRRTRASSAPSTHSSHVTRGPRMRPKRSVVDRFSHEPAAPKTVLRLRAVGVIVAAVFSLMFVRLWYLQVLDTKGFAQTVTANQLRNVEVPAPRGVILDRSGGLLVGNQVTQDITLSRVSASEHPEVVGELAALLGITPAQIQSDLSNTQYSLYKPVPILENAPTSDVLYIEEHSSQFPGVSATPDTTRTYPMCPTNPPGQCQTGVQMLGYVGQITAQELKAHPNEGYQLGDSYGQTGLENQYQSALRGSPGDQQVEVNAQGQVVDTIGQTQPQAGDDLVTNIDSGLQQLLQQALDAEIGSLGGSSHEGAAVALDPQNGAVLALVSTPTYNPTWWTSNGISSADYQQIEQNDSLINLAIDGLYTPGSTFKLATATAALDDGLITPDTEIDDTGTYTIPGCTGGDCVFHDNEGEANGPINVTQALTVSSDIFFYNLGVDFWDGYQAGHFPEDSIQGAAAALGYGQVTGIDLPGETHDARVDSPQVVAREHAQDPTDYPDGSWYSGSNLELAFGQGGTVITPLQQAVAYATFANGGTRYAPQIGAALVNPSNGKVVQTFAPKVIGHVPYSAANYQAMLSGFEGVVNNPSGTAYGVFNSLPPGFQIAGKTGTATVQEGSNANSWFVGWGPLPNPQYVIATVVQGGGYGSQAAAPVVAQAFNYIAANPAPAVRLAAPPALTSAICGRTSPGQPGSVATLPGESSVTGVLGTTEPSSTGACAPTSEAPGSSRVLGTGTGGSSPAGRLDVHLSAPRRKPARGP